MPRLLEMKQTWTFFPIFQGTQFGNRAGGRSEKLGVQAVKDHDRFLFSTKGLLISKCPLGGIVWTKISTNGKFDKFMP